ncbi:MAG TPA: 2-oxoglutarate and iron-dependent oxygenase domain-containing protein [Polyangiaceae bacterium]
MTAGSSRAFREVPLVDISGLDTNLTTLDRAAVDQMGRAASEVGFLYVTGHGIPPALIRDLERAAQAFFALPEEIKLRYYIGRSSNHRGYVPPGEEVFYGKTRDTKEAFDLSRDLPPGDYGAASRFLGPNVWPDELPGFREAVTAYYEAAFALGRRLLRGFVRALGLPADRLDGFVQRPPSQLRLVHYPPASELENTMGIGAHTDYECFTILHATSPGLQVMNSEGRWVDAPPIDGAFVINIGDLFQVLSNGVYVSTSHRVLPTIRERFSFPFFFNLDYETVVAPLPELSKDGSLHGPLVAGAHLLAQTMQSFRYMQRLSERGELTLPAGSHALSSFGRERTS